MVQEKKEIVIIGAGIAGLYAAYKIRILYPVKKITILEANYKKEIGGRMGSRQFAGTTVVTGAGIGRKRKDKLLIKLLQSLDVPYSEFLSEHCYANTIESQCNVKQTFLSLLATRRKNINENNIKKTFKDFALPILGQPAYDHFITCSGYSDYEEEDFHDTLYNYGFDDNYDNWTGLSISWLTLVNALIDKIGMENIHTNTEVIRIKEITNSEKTFVVFTANKKVYRCNQIILATTIDSLRKLLPREPIYREIGGQPFIRVYGKFSKSSQPIIKEYVEKYTIVPGVLQKIIPIDTEKGVYMIAYSDNAKAKWLQRYSENTEENREKFSKLIRKSLGIGKEKEVKLNSIVSFYWKIGTHYYHPLNHEEYNNRKEFIKKAQNPKENIFVIGEAVSLNQGWVEGALESVENITSHQLLFVE
jgi:hypothetical protein